MINVLFVKYRKKKLFFLIFKKYIIDLIEENNSQWKIFYDMNLIHTLNVLMLLLLLQLVYLMDKSQEKFWNNLSDYAQQSDFLN